MNISTDRIQQGKHLRVAQTVSEGMLGLMNTKDRKRGKLQPPADSANAAISSSDEVKQLKDQLYEMQMEIDLLKATIDVLKKTPASIWRG